MDDINKELQRHSSKVIYLAVVEVKVTLADGGAHRRRDFSLQGAASFLSHIVLGKGMLGVLE